MHFRLGTDTGDCEIHRDVKECLANCLTEDKCVLRSFQFAMSSFYEDDLHPAPLGSSFLAKHVEHSMQRRNLWDMILAEHPNFEMVDKTMLVQCLIHLCTRENGGSLCTTLVAFEILLQFCSLLFP